jgi:hypothetical protein
MVEKGRRKTQVLEFFNKSTGISDRISLYTCFDAAGAVLTALWAKKWPKVPMHLNRGV